MSRPFPTLARFAICRHFNFKVTSPSREIVVGPKSLRLELSLATVLALVCAGCGSSSGSARTVSYFQAHPKERESVFKRCADDPGTLGKSAECVNAERAEEIEGIGSFSQLAPMHFPPMHRTTGGKGMAAPNPNSAPSR